MRTPMPIVAACSLGIALVSGCSSEPASGAGQRVPAAVSPSDTPSATLSPIAHLVQATVLITQPKPLTAKQVRELRHLSGVTRSVLIGYGDVWIYDRSIPAAAVDVDTYRVFTPAGTANSAAVWTALERGAGVISHQAGNQNRLPLDATIPAGWSTLRLAGFVTTVPGIDLVVSVQTGQRIGVPFGNGLILAGKAEAGTAIAAQARRLLGNTALVRTISKAPTAGSAAQQQPLLPTMSPSVPPTGTSSAPPSGTPSAPPSGRPSILPTGRPLAPPARTPSAGR